MALVTFTSDFGLRDHYTGAVRAAIMAINPALQIVDLCHGISNCDLAHASFVLNALFRSFSPGTVHLVAVGSDTCELHNNPIAIQLEGHFFVGANNGLFSLLSNQKPSIATSLDALPQQAGSFAAKNKLATASAMLASGKSIYDLGSTDIPLQALTPKEATQNKQLLQGHIIHVDAVGNLITNLSKEAFQAQQKENKAYKIVVGREHSQSIHTSYEDVDGGECFYIFNDLGLLEIGIRYGSAHELLGLGYDAPIYIQFSPPPNKANSEEKPPQ